MKEERRSSRTDRFLGFVWEWISNAMPRHGMASPSRMESKPTLPPHISKIFINRILFLSSRHLHPSFVSNPHEVPSIDTFLFVVSMTTTKTIDSCTFHLASKIETFEPTFFVNFIVLSSTLRNEETTFNDRRSKSKPWKQRHKVPKRVRSDSAIAFVRWNA